MRLFRLTPIVAVLAALLVPVASAENSTTVGTGSKTCEPSHHADCSGVVHKFGVEHHGVLHHANFRGSAMHHADFSGAILHHADFRGSKLHYTDFSGANLKHAKFGVLPKRGGNVKQAQEGPSCNPTCDSATLFSANFSGANLGYANFNYANLTSANLTGANLASANLTNAYLPSANLTNAYLTSANLTRANLNGTSLTSANLTSANLTGAYLAGADLTGVVWNNTTCPNGLNSNNTGGTCVGQGGGL